MAGEDQRNRTVQVRIGNTEVAFKLNPDGYARGDGRPHLALHPSTSQPMVVWAYWAGTDYDIAFVDAPYGSKKVDRIVNTWAACHFARILGVEHARDHVLPNGRLRGRARLSGETGVTIFRASIVDGLRR